MDFRHEIGAHAASQHSQATVAEQAHGGVGAADDRARLRDGQAGDDTERHHLGLFRTQAAEERDRRFYRGLPTRSSLR